MRGIVIVAVVLALALPLRAEIDRADPEPSPVAAMLAGTATALVPLAIGGGLMAMSDATKDRQRRTGLDLIVTGFALAPIVSELTAREWKRAAIFGAVSLVFGGIAIGTVEWRDGSINLASVEAKNVYGVSVTATVIVAAAGVIDSMLARERWGDRQKKKRQHAFVAPTLGRAELGLAVGGQW